MRGRRVVAGALAIVGAAWVAGWAQGPAAPEAEGPVRAVLTVPPGQYTVGDPISMTLTLTHPQGTQLDPPDLSSLTAPPAGSTGDRGAAGGGDSPADLTMEPPRLQTPDPPDPRRTTWIVTIRPFRTGEMPVPAVSVRYQLAGSATRGTATTQPTTIRVASVLKTEDEPPADIRGPWRLPAVWWPLALGAILAAVAAWMAWKGWRRLRARRVVKPSAPPPPPPEPVESPYDRAQRELARLLASRLLAEGRIKEFHVRLSEIVKAFLGRHLGFDAVDRTTEEVLRDLAAAGVRGEVREPTHAFLEACDLVKFAKHRPEGREIDETVARARLLIETGRPVARPKEEVAA
ncbi:MAG: hypothetical protein ACREAA_03140 [Candidatus Polarisedimenticolia bacterium]